MSTAINIILPNINQFFWNIYNYTMINTNAYNDKRNHNNHAILMKTREL